MTGIKEYTKNSNHVATNEQLVLKAYEKAITLMWEARAKLEAGDKLTCVQDLHISRSLFLELKNSLNDEGGDVSTRLHQLYGFIIQELSTAGFSGSIQALDNALAVAEQLYEGFFDAFTQESHKNWW